MAFGYASGFENGEVQVRTTRSVDDVAPRVAKRIRQRRSEGRHIKPAPGRSLRWRQISIAQPVSAGVGPVRDVQDSAAIHSERQTGLQSKNAGRLPATDN